VTNQTAVTTPLHVVLRPKALRSACGGLSIEGAPKGGVVPGATASITLRAVNATQAKNALTGSLVAYADSGLAATATVTITPTETMPAERPVASISATEYRHRKQTVIWIPVDLKPGQHVDSSARANASGS
jgi:hypothetical protein